MKGKLTTLTMIASAAVLAACGYVSEYEEGVYDYEPLYCYRSLAGIQCFEEPNPRDERRLVNYYGPAPSRYERPAPPEPATLHAPPPVDFYVRDREPVPTAASPGDSALLPWPKGADRAPPAASPTPPIKVPTSVPAAALAPPVVEFPDQLFELN